MTLKSRLLISTTSIFAVSLCMFAASWWISSAQKGDALAINLAGRQRMLTQRMAADVLAYASADRDGQASRLAVESLRTSIRTFDKTLNALRNSGTAPLTLSASGPGARLQAADETVRKHLDNAAAEWSDYRDMLLGILETPDSTDSGKLISHSRRVLDRMNDAVTAMQAASENRVVLLLTAQSCLLVLGLLLLGFVFLRMIRNFTTPLEKLRAYTVEVAEGNLSASVDNGFSHELLQLKEAVEMMVQKLSRAMEEARRKEDQARISEAETQKNLKLANDRETEIRSLLDKLGEVAGRAGGISENVTSSAEGLSAQVNQVSFGTQSQRDRMAEASNAMGEMNNTVLDVARAASSAAEYAEQARKNARTGADGVREAVAAFDGIRERIIDINRSMSRLGERADGIGQIMGVISDIADQTNLLALNAAIEAARAGDAGRGFAVVADEVRKLAEKTMQATKEVESAIEQIQHDTRENLEAVEAATTAIVQSTDQARESGAFMDEIVTIVEDTAGQVASIATAAEEQSAASDEINRAVDEVSRIAQDTARDMTEAAESLVHMTELAQELDSTIRDLAETAGISVSAKSAGAAGNGNGNGRKKAVAALVKWSPSLSVGIEEIDGQHMQLVDLINDLHAALSNGEAKDRLEGILKELRNYTVFHFGHEEKLMKGYDYPNIEDHLREHKKFVTTVVDFDKNFRSGKAALTMEIMNFLRDWLIHHIQGTDQKYGPFFNSRGVH